MARLDTFPCGFEGCKNTCQLEYVDSFINSGGQPFRVTIGIEPSEWTYVQVDKAVARLYCSLHFGLAYRVAALKSKLAAADTRPHYIKKHPVHQTSRKVNRGTR